VIGIGIGSAVVAKDIAMNMSTHLRSERRLRRKGKLDT
jgi:hypothetical protein